MTSPFFHTISTDSALELRVAMKGVSPSVTTGITPAVLEGVRGPTLEIQTVPVTIADCTQVSSVTAAETVLLNIPTITTFDVVWTGLDAEQQNVNALNIVTNINALSSTIAMCSRRGNGNTVLMGENVFNVVKQAMMNNTQFVQVSDTIQNDWSKMATLFLNYIRRFRVNFK